MASKGAGLASPGSSGPWRAKGIPGWDVDPVGSCKQKRVGVAGG